GHLTIVGGGRPEAGHLPHVLQGGGADLLLRGLLGLGGRTQGLDTPAHVPSLAPRPRPAPAPAARRPPPAARRPPRHSSSRSASRSTRQSLETTGLPFGYSKATSPSRLNPALRHTAFDAGWEVLGKACR